MLRNLSLSAVHVDWDNTLALVDCQNLRKPELSNLTYDVEPSFEQFVAMLSSPRLEYSNVSEYCPERRTGPAPPVRDPRR